MKSLQIRNETITFSEQEALRLTIENYVDLDLLGEIKSLENLPNLTFKRFGAGKWMGKPTQEHIDEINKAFNYLLDSLDHDYDILIADEILYAVQLNLLSEEKVLKLIDKAKSKSKELILTGSHKPFSIIFEKADLITEVRKIKHPFDSGIQSRKGIEY